eukprot:gene4059-8077_t
MSLFGKLILASFIIESETFHRLSLKIIKGGIRKRYYNYLSTKKLTSEGALYSSQKDLQDIYYIPVDFEHPRTSEFAIKHCETFGTFVDNHVVSRHTVEAFSLAQSFVDEFYNGTSIDKPVILDSGCGVGMSTTMLAKKYPKIPIIGIDKSIVRLQKNKNFEDPKDFSSPEDFTPPTLRNMLLLRAELVDFWWLCAEQSDWTVHSHYILYPNPYPKAQHLSRRWHGHPIFPVLLGLGGRVVIRSNWPVYCREFMQATQSVVDEKNLLPGLENPINMSFTAYTPDPPMTHFERKYQNADVPVYQLLKRPQVPSSGKFGSFVYDISQSVSFGEDITG